MGEIKPFPIIRRRRDIQALADELHRLDDERRESRWRSEMERFCRRLVDMGVSQADYRSQVGSFSTAVHIALAERRRGSSPDDAA